MTSSNWMLRRLRAYAGDATSRVQEWRTKQALGDKAHTTVVGAVALAVVVGSLLWWRRRLSR